MATVNDLLIGIGSDKLFLVSWGKYSFPCEVWVVAYLKGVFTFGWKDIGEDKTIDIKYKHITKVEEL